MFGGNKLKLLSVTWPWFWQFFTAVFLPC